MTDIGKPPEISHATTHDAEWEAFFQGRPLQQANPVLDGTTGAILTEVDGEPAEVRFGEQPALVEVALEDLVHDLAVARRRAATALSEAKEASRYAKTQLEAVEAIVAELARRDNPVQTEIEFEDEE